MPRSLRTLLALIAAASLLFGQALAQDADGAQEAPAAQDAGAEDPPADSAGDAAQKDDGGAAAAENPAADAELDPAADPEIGDSDLDNQAYEGEDDVFIPTEEIPADEPIPFPSDR
jgi:hypothetical protein